MAASLGYLWKDITPAELETIGATGVIDTHRVARVLGMDPRAATSESWAAGLVEYMTSLLVFARDSLLPAPQTSILFSLVHETLTRALAEKWSLHTAVTHVKAGLVRHTLPVSLPSETPTKGGNAQDASDAGGGLEKDSGGDDGHTTQGKGGGEDGRASRHGRRERERERESHRGRNRGNNGNDRSSGGREGKSSGTRRENSGVGRGGGGGVEKGGNEEGESKEEGEEGGDGSGKEMGNGGHVLTLLQVKAMMEFLSSTLFQHYSLFILAGSLPQPQVISTEEVVVEVPIKPYPLALGVRKEVFERNQERKLQDLDTMLAAASRGKSLQSQLEQYLAKATPLLRTLAVTHSIAQLQGILEENVDAFCALYKSGVDDAMAAREAALLQKLASLPLSDSHSGRRTSKDSHTGAGEPGASSSAGGSGSGGGSGGGGGDRASNAASHAHEGDTPSPSRSRGDRGRSGSGSERDRDRDDSSHRRSSGSPRDPSARRSGSPKTSKDAAGSRRSRSRRP